MRSSGTQDLGAAYYPETDYEFIRPVQQHSDLSIGAQPVSTPFERVRVQVANPNSVQVAGQGTFFNRGMKVRSFADDLQDIGMYALADVPNGEPNQAARLVHADQVRQQIVDLCK